MPESAVGFKEGGDVLILRPLRQIIGSRAIFAICIGAIGVIARFDSVMAESMGCG